VTCHIGGWQNVRPTQNEKDTAKYLGCTASACAVDWSQVGFRHIGPLPTRADERRGRGDGYRLVACVAHVGHGRPRIYRVPCSGLAAELWWRCSALGSAFFRCSCPQSMPSGPFPRWPRTVLPALVRILGIGAIPSGRAGPRAERDGSVRGRDGTAKRNGYRDIPEFRACPEHLIFSYWLPRIAESILPTLPLRPRACARPDRRFRNAGAHMAWAI